MYAAGVRSLLYVTAVLYLYGTSAGVDGYMIGRGIADSTGVVAEGLMYGFADLSHDARGFHMLQYSRAFVIADETDDKQRIAYVVTEMTMMSQAVRLGVLERLAELYGDLYTEQNVMLSTTHTHSGPGGFLTYYMYQIASGGFVNETYNAYVNGIVQSIQMAHDDLQLGRILVNTGTVPNAGVNRSPASYDNNPQEERDRYTDNVDREMTVLRFQSQAGEDLGVLTFLPVHQTSMKSSNHLVSSDNKGYAALRFEQEMNPGSLPGEGNFIAPFANTGEGDVSPDVKGAKCTDTGEPCDYVTSSCPSNPSNPGLCVSSGPTGDMFVDTAIIGERQYRAARELFDSAVLEVTGPIGFVHQWVNTSDITVMHEGQEVQTCRPSMGYSFAAGATDGPGTPPFIQGQTEGIPLLDVFINLVFPYSETLRTCQEPKPILLPTGEIGGPWPWQPDINPLQILRIGEVILIGLPGEFTTMSGRRIRDAVTSVLEDNGITGTLYMQSISLTNGYASYVTTYEEYQIQRYEGASTINGPHTLQGYIQELELLAESLALGNAVEPNEAPPDLRGLPNDALGDVRKDDLPFGTDYGDILEDVKSSYTQGQRVSVTFISGNPRLNHQTGKSFLEVQRDDDIDWVTEYNDGNWETKMFWNSDCADASRFNYRCKSQQASNVTITWDIPGTATPANYRIVHNGNAQTSTGVVPYTGMSSTFEVLSINGRRRVI